MERQFSIGWTWTCVGVDVVAISADISKELRHLLKVMKGRKRDKCPGGRILACLKESAHVLSGLCIAIEFVGLANQPTHVLDVLGLVHGIFG